MPRINYTEKINLPAATTAFIIVDMQNDFVKEGGSFSAEAAKETILLISSLNNVCVAPAVTGNRIL